MAGFRRACLAGRWPAVGAAGCGVYFFVVACLIEATRTDYNPARIALSYYAHRRGGLWVNTAIWSGAVGFAALAWTLRRALAPAAASSTGLGLLVVSAFGAGLSGSFDLEPPAPHFPPTTIGEVMHTIGSFIAIFSFCAAMFVLLPRFRRDDSWRSFFPVGLAIAGCFALAFLAWLASFAFAGLGSCQGAIEDIMLGSMVLAQMALAMAAYSRLGGHVRISVPLEQTLGKVAVGTALAGGPPHRSQRAGLPHWAPALGCGGEADLRVGVHHAWSG